MRDFSKITPEITEEAEFIASSELLRSADNAITEHIGAAIEVHRHLGPGLLESAYEQCLCYELSQLALPFRRQVHLPISYTGLKLSSGLATEPLTSAPSAPEAREQDKSDHLKTPPRESPRLRDSAVKRSPR